MIKEENEKIAICPVCLVSLTVFLFFTSDDYLYHRKFFSKLNFKSPISRQDFSYYFPVNKLVNDKVYFEKKTLEIILEYYMIKMNLTGKELMNMDIIAIRKILNKQ